MDNKEHDRRIVAVLRYFETVVGPLLRFDRATKHRLFMYFTEVKADVRRSLIVPKLKESGVEFRFRRVPLFAYKNQRIKKSHETRTFKMSVGEEWELCFSVKSTSPKWAHVPEEAFEVSSKLNNNSLLFYSGPSYLYQVDKGLIDGGEVADTLQRLLDREGKVDQCPPATHHSFRGVTSTNSGRFSSSSSMSQKPSPSKRTLKR